MTKGHPPECRAHEIHGLIVGDCICEELQACEERLLNDVQKQVEDMSDLYSTRYSNRISRNHVWLLIEQMRRP